MEKGNKARCAPHRIKGVLGVPRGQQFMGLAIYIYIHHTDFMDFYALRSSLKGSLLTTVDRHTVEGISVETLSKSSFFCPKSKFRRPIKRG